MNGQEWEAGSEADRQKGTPIAGGLFGVVWFIKGDLDWLANTLDLEHSSSTFCCPWCKANTIEGVDDWRCAVWNVVPRPWNDITDTAAYIGSIWTSGQEWLDEHGGLANVHPLFALPGVSILNVAADMMHMIDLGVAHHVVGNVLWLLCFTPQFIPSAHTPQTRLDVVWSRVASQYSSRGTPDQLTNLKLEMCIDVGSPQRSTQ